jgi:acyl-CoA reductase-like NAD-dependent aldehyde dehydrogenase
MQSSEEQKHFLIGANSALAEHTHKRFMSQAEYIDSINPSTEEEVGSYQLHTEEQIEKTLNEEQKIILAWREETFSKRFDIMRKAAFCLHENKMKHTSHVTAETGKQAAESEAVNCSSVAGLPFLLYPRIRITSCAGSQ